MDKETLLPTTRGTRISAWVEQHKALILLVGIVTVVAAALVVVLLVVFLQSNSNDNSHPGPTMRLPLVIATWGLLGAADAAWEQLSNPNKTALDAVEKGCNYCEDNPNDCGFSVGFGGSPNEKGETTLDAMIMWAPTRQVGSVGCLKRVKHAISVARKVLEETYHTLLVGEDATQFALSVGFPEQSLQTNYSKEIWENWIKNGHQPNYWKGHHNYSAASSLDISESNHDTIGMIAIDKDGHVSCGTSTNGLTFKIPGRVGDSPIVGSGAYCEDDVGGAAATGDGDIMMRFAPTRMIVSFMKNGHNPNEAVSMVMNEIRFFYPNASAAFVAVNKRGEWGAGHYGFARFPYVTRSAVTNSAVVHR